MAEVASPGVVRVRPGATSGTKQGIPQFAGISGRTAGARAISMNVITVPPGGAAEPHRHVGYETAIYVVSGRVDTRFGPGLRESLITEAGDFIYIAPDVPHQPVNLSDTEPAVAVVARTDPEEQESVVLYDPAEDQA